MSVRIPTDISTCIERLGHDFPDKMAIKFKKQTLNYADLNQALGSFAHKLDQTVSRRTPLPILAGVNLNTFIAIYSAMRAGIAFSAIDSSNPQSAIDEILVELGSPEHIVIAKALRESRRDPTRRRHASSATWSPR